MREKTNVYFLAEINRGYGCGDCILLENIDSNGNITHALIDTGVVGLYYEIICLETMNLNPIVTCSFHEQSVKQYTTIHILLLHIQVAIGNTIVEDTLWNLQLRTLVLHGKQQLVERQVCPGAYDVLEIV